MLVPTFSPAHVWFYFFLAITNVFLGGDRLFSRNRSSLQLSQNFRQSFVVRIWPTAECVSCEHVTLDFKFKLALGQIKICEQILNRLTLIEFARGSRIGEAIETVFGRTPPAIDLIYNKESRN